MAKQESKHTKGELIACSYISPQGKFRLANDKGYTIAGLSMRRNAQADAERLALCWNSHDALLEALNTYGEHTKECHIQSEIDFGKGRKCFCTCGFEQALKESE